jgi:hypothetical protein
MINNIDLKIRMLQFNVKRVLLSISTSQQSLEEIAYEVTSCDFNEVQYLRTTIAIHN